MINIDFEKIVDQLPDIERRTQKRLDWMKIYARYLKNTYQRILTEYNAAMFTVSHTSQVLSIQDALNRSISLNHPITITDGLHFLTYYMNLINEKYSEDSYMFEDVGTDETYMFTDSENEYENYFDLYINVHNTDMIKLTEIKRIIDTYIAAGITYKIITI